MIKKEIGYIFLILTLSIGIFSCEKNEEFIEEKIQIIEKEFFITIGTDSISYTKAYAYYCEYIDSFGSLVKEIKLNNREDFAEVDVHESEVGDFSIVYHETDGSSGCTFFYTLIDYNGVNAKAHSYLYDDEKILSQADFERITGSVTGELFVHDTILVTFTSLGDFSSEFDIEVSSDCL